MENSKVTAKTKVKNVVRDQSGRVTAFDIDRRKWGRGKTGGELLQFDMDYEIYDEEGHYIGVETQEVCACCLGIYLRACGMRPSTLSDHGMPSGLVDDEVKVPEQALWLLDKRGARDSRPSKILASINDKEDTKDAVKEKGIINHFGKQGITVTFTN